MAKISTYSLADNPLLLSDRLIGTEAIRTPPSPTPLATKNFSLGELLNLFSVNFPSPSLQEVLDTGNTATQNIYLTGSIEVDLIKPVNIEDTTGSQGTVYQYLSKGASSISWVTLPIDNLQAVLNSGNTATQNITLVGNVTSTYITPGNIKDELLNTGAVGQVLTKSTLGVQWANSSVPTAPSLADVLSTGNTATNDINLTGDMYATSFVKSGGTSSEFLKADGSIDSSAYALASSLPTVTSDLTNDGDDGINPFISLADVPAQVNADWNATSGVAEILNKPTIGSGTVTSVGTTGLISGGPITSSGTITTSMATNKLVGRYSASTGIMEEISVGSGLTLTGAGVLNNTATPTPSGYYGAWQDNVTQTAAVSNTGYPMIFRTIDLENQVRVVTNGTNLTRITFDNTGVYNLQFSSQFQNTDTQEHDVTIWLRFNGVDVPASSGFIAVPSKHGGINGHCVVSWNYLLNVVAGDYYELMWSTTDATHITMQFYAAGSPPPSAASVILTVTQQAGIMAGTGITAINSLTGAVQTLATGTSGTDFAISSATSTHTFNLPTASAANRGALSSADWTTFNGKFTLPALTSGSVLFSNGTTIAQDNAQLFWDDTNNRLGIGTNNPSAYYAKKLVIAAPDEDGITILANSVFSSSYLAFADGATGNEAFRGYISYKHLSDQLAFGSAGTLRMTISSGGNLLINTTTDAGFKLDVNGTARVSGNATFGTLGTGTGMFWDNTNNRLGIGTATPTYNLDIISSSSPNMRITRNGATEIRIGASTLATGGLIGTYSASPLIFLSNSAESMRLFTTGNVGIGTTTDVASSILTLASTTKGFLPPRMTNAQRLAIATPAVGLIVYCTDVVEGLYINKSTGWTFII